MLKDEYVYENDQSIGFFNTAENYLEIALSSIERYKKNLCLSIIHHLIKVKKVIVIKLMLQ